MGAFYYFLLYQNFFEKIFILNDVNLHQKNILS